MVIKQPFTPLKYRRYPSNRRLTIFNSYPCIPYGSKNVPKKTVLIRDGNDRGAYKLYRSIELMVVVIKEPLTPVKYAWEIIKIQKYVSICLRSSRRRDIIVFLDVSACKVLKNMLFAFFSLSPKVLYRNFLYLYLHASTLL